VISHQQNLSGKTYASIDAVSKPTKKVTASGTYDPAAARQRYADWQAKQQAGPAPKATTPQAPAAAPVKSAAASGAPAPKPEYDPEVGF
jgi:hypothetical protein